MVYLINIYSHPVEFLLVGNEEGAVDRLHEIGLHLVADGAEAPVVPLVFVYAVALGVAEGEFATLLGSDAVALQFAIGIDDSFAERIRMSVCSNELIPRDVLALVSIQDISQLSAVKPTVVIIGKNGFTDSVVLAVQIVCVYELA